MLESVELIAAISTAKSPVAIIHKVTTFGNFFALKGNTFNYCSFGKLYFCVTCSTYDMHMTNLEQVNFHGLTVAQLLPDGRISLGQVKNAFSGTSLSGNWIFDIDNSDEISSVCRSHILIATQPTLELIRESCNQSVFDADFNELVSSIQSEEIKLRNEWDAHLLENPKKAKTLVQPTWANWENALAIEDPISSLNNLGRSAHPDSTPDDMKSLIALARMTRYVLDIWRELEESRFSRKFLSVSKEDPRLWPPNWKISERGSK